MSAELNELLLDIDVDDALLVTLDETELDEAGIEETGLDEAGLDETGVDETALDKDEALDNAPVDDDEVSPGDELPPHATNADIHTAPIKRVIVEYMLIPVIKSGSRLS